MFDKEPNIDIVFRNGLKDFEALPPSDVWDAMPPIIPLHSWKRYIYPVAATLAILMTLGAAMNFLVRKPAANNDQLAANNVLTEQKINSVTKVDEPAGARMVKMRPDAVTTYPKSNVETAISGEMNPLSMPLTTAQTRELVRSTTKKETAVFSGGPFATPQLLDLISFTASEKELASVKTKRGGLSKLMVGGSLSPAYSYVSSGGSSKVSDLKSSEDGIATYTGGISVALDINSRFSVQTGVSLTTMGQTVYGIDVYAGLSHYYSSKGSFIYSVETASGKLIAENTDLYFFDSKSGSERVSTYVPDDILDPTKLKLDYLDSKIKQLFRYVEVPVVARYKIIDRGVDLNLSGGFTYGILIENSAFTVVDRKNVKIGYTDGVNNNFFSSQVGVGMEYDISKSVSLNLEPVFRYYLTPFNDLSGTATRPYSFGVFSGFFFRF